MKIRPCTTDDVKYLVPEPIHCRIRAWTGEIDGKPVGIGGIMYLPNGENMAFLYAQAVARKHRFALHRAAVNFFAECRKLGIRRVFANASHDIEAAPRWLTRLGFKQIKQDTWVWQD